MSSPVPRDGSSDSEPAASPIQMEDHDELMTDVESSKTHSESPSTASDKRPTTPRVKKANYVARKEEKEFLLKEMDILQTQLKQLKRHAALNAKKSDQERTSVQRELSQEFLEGVSRQQQMSLVNIQSALSGYVSVQQNVPFEMWIYLGTNVEERRRTLASLKERKLRAAKLYLVERTRFLDPSSPFAEHSRFVAHNGDYCALRFDITPYEGISSVRKVYDALCHYFSHTEIWVTDILGDMTIREDDDSGKGITQKRLVSSLTNGIELEMNNVMYTEFREHDDEFGDGGACGLFTTDFVDKDELFPYKPSERMRYDVTAVLAVNAQQRKKVNAAGKLVDEHVVVLTRSCLIKLRHREIKLPFEIAHELREGVGKWGDVMLQTEEIQSLHEQVKALQVELAQLQKQQDAEADLKSQGMEQEVLDTDCVRQAVLVQQASLVSVQAALSRLSKPARTLGDVNGDKTGREAKFYLRERGRFVDETSAFANYTRFEEDGAFCDHIYDVVPFEGISSVKVVYDALHYYFSHMEIRVTEGLGDITIREDDGSSESGISQCRFVSYVPNGPLIEMNFIVYSEFKEVDEEFGDGGVVGIFTEDFVEQDELYPYFPDERVRQDATVVTQVRAHMKTARNAAGVVKEQPIVMMERWAHCRIHKPKMVLYPGILHEIREKSSIWGDIKLDAVRKLVYGPNSVN